MHRDVACEPGALGVGTAHVVLRAKPDQCEWIDCRDFEGLVTSESGLRRYRTTRLTFSRLLHYVAGLPNPVRKRPHVRRPEIVCLANNWGETFALVRAGQMGIGRAHPVSSIVTGSSCIQRANLLDGDRRDKTKPGLAEVMVDKSSRMQFSYGRKPRWLTTQNLSSHSRIDIMLHNR